MITDKMMQEAAEELYQALLTSLPDENQCSYQFSERFERRMKRLIRRAEHPLRHRILQRVASITLVLFLGFVTLLAISPSVRAAVFGWVREQYDSFAAYYFEGAPQNTDNLIAYELGSISLEYEEINRLVTECETTIYYLESSSGKIMTFTYTHESDSFKYHIKQDDAIIEKAIVNGCDADVYCFSDEKQSNVIIWVDRTTHTLFRISAFMDKDDLISLASSVKKLE